MRVGIRKGTLGWAALVCAGLACTSLLSGCGDDASCAGVEGCACYPNKTCNSGLTCASNLCVDLDGPDRDAATRGEQNDAGRIDAGEPSRVGTVAQGGDCKSSAQCEPIDDPCRTAVCISGSCRKATKPAGSAVPEDIVGDCRRPACDDKGGITYETDVTDVAPDDDDDPCTTTTCETGAPGVRTAEAGTPLAESAQSPGDCLRLVCNGAGEIGSEIDANDVPRGTAACEVGICDGSNPTSVVAPVGTACGSGLVCNDAGACVACKGEGADCGASGECCDGLCENLSCGACAEGSGDCDGSPANGCETALTAAPNCGRCGEDCSGLPDVASTTCSGGQCAIARCVGGRADADGMVANGCEAAAQLGDAGAYGPCTADDVTTACGVGSACRAVASLAGVLVQLTNCSASSTGCFCGFPCSTAADCPAAPEGNATKACSSGYCVLSCGSGTTCPAGMTCPPSTLGVLSSYCIWQ